MVIYGPAAADYDIDLGHVHIAEFYNLTICQEDWFAERFGPPTASNYLINGQNIKPDGSAGTRAKFNFTPGKKHLLRLINTSVDNHFKFTLDGHTMTVISTDFVPINPYTTSILNINIGQRYEVVIEANQPTANYWARVSQMKSEAEHLLTNSRPSFRHPAGRTRIPVLVQRTLLLGIVEPAASSRLRPMPTTLTPARTNQLPRWSRLLPSLSILLDSQHRRPPCQSTSKELL